jgi:hypothetical protein
MDNRKQSNYARKSAYLKTYNHRADKAEGAKPGARVWGFDFPIGAKPWTADR